MARKSRAGKPGRIKQIVETYRAAAKLDPRLTLYVFGSFFAVLAVFVLVGILTKNIITWSILGFGLALLAAVFLFGRRAQRASYRSIEGQLGAAAAVLQQLRSGWTVTPAVAVTKNQDLVHRVVGRPGVILVSEGPVSRATQLLANERKRTARFAGEVPIHEFSVGSEPGQISLQKLQSAVLKLPKVLRPSEVTALRRRLDAAAAAANPLPIPKGPLPKGARMPKAPKG